MIDKLVSVSIPLKMDDAININRTLELRYLLADTIEARNLGSIVNEGTGNGFIELSFITNNNVKLESELSSLLLSLGFTGNTEITVEDI